MTGRSRIIGLRRRMTMRIVEVAVVLAGTGLTVLLTHLHIAPLLAVDMLRDSQCS